MASTTDMLRTMLDAVAYRALELLADSTSPLSGRAVASALGVAPTTATSALGKLRQAGFATSQREGRADRWRLRTDTPVVGSWLHETRGLTPASARPQHRVVIFTALPEEYAAVLPHLDARRGARAGGTRYEQGEFHGTHIDWTVCVAEIGAGNVGASFEFASAYAEFKPHMALFVGVAGSVKPDDLCRGDVVVGVNAYNIHAGKDDLAADGRAVHLGRPASAPAPHALLQLARTVRRKEWIAELRLVEFDGGVNARGEVPTVELKAIGAGEVVHRNVDSTLMEIIRTRFNDVAAVDMESYGHYEAAYRAGVPGLAVRGISDSVGDKTAQMDRTWQPVAAKHAAAFAFALLREADGEDLGIHQQVPATPAVPGEVPPSATDPLFRLPPAVAVAYEGAVRAAGAPATALVQELAEQGERWSAWLAQFRRTQPPLFRGAQSGPLWTLVAAYADSHHDPTGAWIYEQAAEHTADDPTRSYLYGRAALAAAGADNRNGAESFLARARELSPHGEAVWNLLRAGIDNDAKALLQATASLIEPFDLGFLRPALADAPSPKSPPNMGVDAYLSELSRTSPELLEQLRFLVASWTGFALQVTGRLASAQLLFETLNQGLPAFREHGAGSDVRGSLVGPRTATVLTHLARTLSARAAESTDTGPGFDTDRALATAFDLALAARDRLLDWHGPTTEVLQIAALARARAGDPRGALRLLLPPPQGTALPSEAAAQPVMGLAAELAATTGQPELAFQLAKRLDDAVERHIATGLAYLNRPDCRNEAAAEFRSALAAATERPDQQARAVLTLALVTEPTDDELALVEGFDRQTADLVRAQSHLTAGRSMQAQLIARRYPSSEASTQIRVQALLAEGNVIDAVQTLERHARQHSDERFLAQAATLAAASDRLDEAERLARLLAASRDSYRRRVAGEILVDAASRNQDWDRVLTEADRLIADGDIAENDPDRAEHLVSYRWARALALFQLRRLPEAYEAIRSMPPLRPATQSQARLVISLLHFLAPSVHTVGDIADAPAAVITQAEVLGALTAAALAFPDEEEIVAGAVMTSFRLPVDEPLDPEQLTQARLLQEQFFTRFPDSRLIQRIPTGDTQADLIAALRPHLAPEAEHVGRMGRLAWAGQIPLSVYTTSIHRSYAEGLVRNALEAYALAHPDPQISLAEEAAALEAMNGTAVVDTSALFLAGTTFGDVRDLRSHFDRWLVTTSQRDDILAARASLQMISPYSIGWDPYADRPTMRHTDDETNRRWSNQADSLARHLDLCEVAPDLDASEGGGRFERMWNSPIHVAIERGLPLLADDAALRSVARNEGLAAFSSLAVLQALVHDGRKPQTAIEEAYQRLMEVRGADLPLLERIVAIGARDGWAPSSYAVFLLARPATWIRLDRGLEAYFNSIRAMPNPDLVTIVAWCEAAIFGACQVVSSAFVPVAASTIIAWTCLQIRDAELLPRLLDACDRVVAQFNPQVDLLESTTRQIVSTLRPIVPPPHLGAATVAILRGLDDERRQRAMRVFFTVR